MPACSARRRRRGRVCGASSPGDARRAHGSGRMTRGDGSVIDCATAPLPDGETLVDLRRRDRQRQGRAGARRAQRGARGGERVKNDFVHHVSYELRSPLTNIIGFVQLLGEGAVGPLNDKQRQYTGYIMSLERCAAGHHQRHSRPRHHRRRRDGARARRGRHSPSDRGGRGRRAPGPRWPRRSVHAGDQIAQRHGRFVADQSASARSCSICSSNAIGFSSLAGRVTVARRAATGE